MLSKESKLRNLPDYYTETQPYCPSSNTSASPFVTQLPDNDYLDVHKTEEEWLNFVQESKDSVSNSWAVFNASRDGSVQHPDVSGLLPIWIDSSK